MPSHYFLTCRDLRLHITIIDLVLLHSFEHPFCILLEVQRVVHPLHTNIYRPSLLSATIHCLDILHQQACNLSSNCRFFVVTLLLPTMADMWRCCLCYDTHLDAIYPACIGCGHPRCGNCKPVSRNSVGGEQCGSTENIVYALGHNVSSTVTEPTTPITQDIDENVSLDITISIKDDAPFETPPSYDAPMPSHNLPRQNMRGWWVCCTSWCKQINNPELTSGRCTNCQHVKCSTCYTYTS